MTPVSPAGTGSLTTTLVAVSGPLLVAVTVNVAVSPTFAVVGDAVFVIAISIEAIEIVAVAESFDEFVSNWSADWNVAVLDIVVPAADEATVPVIVSVALADAVRDGIFQFGAV